jgi:hypothetical protein
MRAKLLSGVKWQGALKQMALKQGLDVYGSPLKQNIISTSESSVQKYSSSRREFLTIFLLILRITYGTGVSNMWALCFL